MKFYIGRTSYTSNLVFSSFVFLLFFATTLEAQVGIATHNIRNTGSEAELTDLRSSILESLDPDRFVEDHDRLAQDSILFVALESKSNLWKKAVSVYRDTNNVVTKAVVKIPNHLFASVSLVRSATGEVIRHRSKFIRDLVLPSTDLDRSIYTSVTKSNDQKVGLITVQLPAEAYADAPVLEGSISKSYKEIQKWCAEAFVPYVTPLQLKMSEGAALSIAKMGEVLVGPWKYDPKTTYKTYRTQARDGFEFIAPEGVSGEFLSLAVMQESKGVKVPSTVYRYGNLKVTGDGTLKTGIALIIPDLGAMELEESKASLDDAALFLTADPSHFYEDSAVKGVAPVVVAMQAYSYEESLQEMTQSLAASKYAELQIFSITERLAATGKSSLSDPQVEIAYNGRRIELKVEGDEKKFSTPVSPASNSRILLRLLPHISAPIRILESKVKKGKVKTGLLASPITIAKIGSSGADVGIGETYSTEVKGLVNFGPANKYSHLRGFRVFEGEEAIFKAIEDGTNIWLLDRLK